MNALTVDAGIEVSKAYAKRALRDATGHAKAFREAFTKIDCLINYLSTPLATNVKHAISEPLI